ncbi:Protein ALP1-like [Frankliniella fusca]|uniref:Protein ALP1-like n=1 Tax=Frankliniella fusca TaxID=407009 RepID=A0AAE1HGZ1_9NEOP|nr:Protein ALP1-like [Frankliniella fusca]KAK3920999.1 Protein ALP1-like [Frankliniella fusca]
MKFTRSLKLVKYYVLLQKLSHRTGRYLMPSEWDKLKTVLLFCLHKEKNQRLRQILLNNALKSRRWHVRPMLQDRELFGAWFSLIPTLREYDQDEYFNFLRMTPESFDWLLERVSGVLAKKSNRKSISPGERLAVTLRYLASGDSHVSLSYLFRIGKQTISKIVTETTAVIWYALKPVVFEPITRDFWRQKAAEFECMWQFPNCVGALDGKHCVFQKFPTRGSEFYNYKGSHSVVLLALCDAKYKFIIVDIGARGREHDGGVFSSSDFGKLFISHRLQFPHFTYRESIDDTLPYVIVGDGAFPLHQHLMKPFDKPIDAMGNFKSEEILFNYRLSRARRVVENAFGILAARFRILRHTTIASETLAQNIILSTVALHNLHLQREDSIPPKQRVYSPPGFADTFKGNGFFKKGRWRYENKKAEEDFYAQLADQEINRPNPTEDDDIAPILIREKFLKLFIHEPVPWQWRIIPPIEEPTSPT